MFKGPTGPQSGRTGRSQAESIGTDPEGFTGAPGYHVQGGHPLTAGYPTGVYSEADPALTSTPSGFDPMPFTIKK